MLFDDMENYDENLNDTTESVVEDIMSQQGFAKSPFSILAACVLKVDSMFFLIVAIQSDVPELEISPVIVVKLTKEQAIKLFKSGIKICRAAECVPTSVLGSKVESKCSFVAGNVVIIVLYVTMPSSQSIRLVILRSPLCTLIAE